MKAFILILALFSSAAWAALPIPIILAQPAYPTDLANSIQIYYMPDTAAPTAYRVIVDGLTSDQALTLAATLPALPAARIEQYKLTPDPLWIRWAVVYGDASNAPYWNCLKLNPSISPATTNGRWKGIYNAWMQGSLLPGIQPMTDADKEKCWQ